MNVFKLKTHPAAGIFPMLDKDELQELANDIKANGQIEPIVLGANPDGELWLVDGRNRREACKMAGVEPVTRTLNGEDQDAFIVSVNINRRHMTKGQRAMAVAMVYPEPAKVRRKGSGSSEIEGLRPGAISEARTVLHFAPEKTALVLSGAEPLSEAYREARSRKNAASGEEARLERLKEAHPDLATKVIEGDWTLVAAEAEGKALDDARRAEVAGHRERVERISDDVDAVLGQPESFIRDCPGVDWIGLCDKWAALSKAMRKAK